jgi:hypothetical protein
MAVSESGGICQHFLAICSDKGLQFPRDDGVKSYMPLLGSRTLVRERIVSSTGEVRYALNYR